MSSSSSSAPLGASYQLLVGPLLIGIVVNAFVFGICIMQLVSYLLAKFEDSWRVLALLVWVYIIDTFQVASSVSMLWHYVVTNFANPEALAFSPWEYATLPIFSALASVPIQHFMAFRIMRFSGSKFLFAYVSFLSWASAALGITSAIQGILHTSIESHVKIIPYADAWLALSVACDLSITVLLLYYLLKSRTGFERTDSIIGTICVTTVKAAVPVTLLCILDLAFLTRLPNYNLHYMCALPVGRLYTNTLMSTLNDRKHLRSQMENSSANRGIGLSTLTTSKHRFQVHPAQVRINIEQDMNVDVDPSSARSVYRRNSSSQSPRFPYSPTGNGMPGARPWSLRPIDDDKYDFGGGVGVGARGPGEEDTDSKASPIAESPNESAQRVVVSNLPRVNTSHSTDGEDDSASTGGVKYEKVGYGY